MQKKTVSGLLLTLLLLSMLTLAFNIQPVSAGGIIYIRSDGTVEGTDKIHRDGDVYTFTDNIYDTNGIVVETGNIVVDGAGYTLQGTGAWWSKGVDVTGSRHNVTIKNVEIKAFGYGIFLFFSSRNSVYGNNITNNLEGIRVDTSQSGESTISANNITKNKGGIHLRASWRNSIHGNYLTNNFFGIELSSPSEYNTISRNNITNNVDGIWLMDGPEYNAIYQNNIAANNRVGMSLSQCWNNVICHNNFMDNGEQVRRFQSTSVWDDGYPSGGNCWSDHVTVDEYSGVNQDELGSDGIVDEPYIIDENNQDNYPLVEPWSPAISATIDNDPGTLNLRSGGQWVTCYIELPDGYDVADIDVSTVMLNDTIPVALLDVPVPDPVPTEIGDYDNDTIPDLMVKFDRAMVSAFILSQRITNGFVTLTITGEVNGAPFEGTGTIRVLMGGGGTGRRK